MKLLYILEQYDTALLDQISADKVDETINLRLPKSVIIQEVISALSSQSYVAGKILYSKPPAYAILDLIIQAPGFMVEVETFRGNVLEYIKILSEKSEQYKGNPEKHPQLYKKILKKAWENDGTIDKSEAHILELIKQELGIWDREHFTLMHDPSILGLWDIEQEYFAARNHLLTTGIILTYENKYVIAEEVAVQVRKALGIEIMNDSFTRLLNCLSKEDLAFALKYFQLNVSGSKDVLVDRLQNCLAPPAEILDLFQLDLLRDICRRENIQVSGAKNTVIANIMHHFDEDVDLKKEESPESISLLPTTPEAREMDVNNFSRILSNLTGQQLHDILYHSSLMTSGSKEEKVKRILDSPWSERSIFNCLRKEDLSQLFRKLNLPVSGSKQELVDRALDFAPEIITTESIEPGSEKISTVELSTATVEPRAIQIISPPDITFPNMEEINKQFPDLKRDEKIILAVLKEAKSITEKELERIVVKYNLNWILHKAHMAELMANLKRASSSPVVQIKSVQNNNIYQWVANEKTDHLVLEKKSARDIIDALRHGVVPKTNLGLLIVGQQTARQHLSEILLEVGPNKSHFKFIRGQYGSGKTFLCSWLKEFAIEHEFAVSFMNISHDQPLSDLPVFFSGMIGALRTPEKTDSSALVDILESWLLNIHNRTAKIEGLDPDRPDSQQQLLTVVEKSIESELANLNDIEPGFSQAIRAFYKGKVTGNTELASNALAWITGSKSLSSQTLREIGVKGYLESNSVFPRIRAILEIISGARYKGVLLLVDELELVRKFPHARQREQALETLRLLIDEAGRNALPGCLIIFTGTDEFFEDERYGLKSYEALAERVMTPFIHENLVSMRQPIISLESLDKERLANVICKIRDLYGIAYNWNSKQFADNETINKLIEEWTIFGEESIDRKPRPVLREFIQMLDLCEENKGIGLSHFLKKAEQSEQL